MIGGTSHRSSFDPEEFPAAVEWVSGKVKDLNPTYIAAMGHSGLVMAGAVSFVTGVPVLAVRKEGERGVAHFGPVTGMIDSEAEKGYVIVDDIVSTGGTVRMIIDRIRQQGSDLGVSLQPIALVLYNAYSTDTDGRDFPFPTFGRKGWGEVA